MELIFTGSQLEKSPAGFPIPDDQVVMLVDLDRCIRCGTCQIACALSREEKEFPGPVRNIHAGEIKKSQDQIFTLPAACRVCRTPCMYYEINNFWIRCPDEKAPAKAKEPACDLCLARMQTGYWPACATRCPMKTIYVGKMEDLRIVLRDKRFRNYGELMVRGACDLTKA